MQKTQRDGLRAPARMVVLSILFLMAACGGGQDGDATSLDEAGLRETAQELGMAMINGDNAEMYTYYSDAWRERCPTDDFLGVMLFARGILGDLEGSEFKIDSVTVEGERGNVDGHIELNGEAIEISENEDEDYPDYWIVEDGEWKATSDDPTPCALDEG